MTADVTGEVTAQARVVVLVDDAESAVRPAVLELLTLARSLGEPVALTLVDPSAEVLSALGAQGVDRVVVAATSYEEQGLAPVVALAIAAAVRHVGADLALLASTFPRKEAAALAARELGAGLLIDVASLRRGPDGLVGGKRVLAGTWDTECLISAPAGVATVRPNAITAEAAALPGVAVVERLEEPLVGAAGGVEVVKRSDAHIAESGRPALAEAPVVVAGGRGTHGDFEAVEELADVLGAAIGATRDVVDEGWIDHSAMVGQTGTTIAPRLYIGAGISGAPHHRGGMQASEVIVAVNIDDEAPLLEIADFAVIGDLASVLTDTAEAIRAHRAASTP